MIEERPMLTIRRHFDRPTRQSILRFQGAATVHLVDAMGGRGGLDRRIKAVNPAAASFVGPALTCYCGPDDTLAMLAAFELAEPGDVIVASTDGFEGSAGVGDLFAAMAKTAGIAAIVTDGLARDTAGIKEAGFPVFAAGVSPNSAARSGPGIVGLPINIGTTTISSGDIVVGDADGVVTIPRNEVDHVYDGLEGVRKAESEYPRGSNGEVRVPPYVREMLESDHVQYVD
jgi:4-hydroxy-4-methyl-2-oxoglutarate aldolase